jgi:hypothetical protein
MMAGEQETVRPLLVVGATVPDPPPHAAMNPITKVARRSASRTRRSFGLD